MRRYSLAQLEALEAIVRLGSYRAAAESLNITQPTASLRIRSLEEALGVSVFEADGRRVKLTPAGVIAANYAERTLRLLDDLEARLRTGDPLQGTLRVGSSETVAIAVLPQIMARFNERYPGLEIELSVGNSFLLAEELDAARLDAAILANPQTSSNLCIEPLARAPVAWVGSASGRIQGGKVSPNILQEHPVFCMPEPSPLHDKIVRWWSAEGGTSLSLSTCNSLAMLARIVIGGLGLSVLPTCILHEEIQKGAVVSYRQSISFEPLEIVLAYPEENASQGISALAEISNSVMLSSRFFMPVTAA